jgi:hypothetical protein
MHAVGGPRANTNSTEYNRAHQSNGLRHRFPMQLLIDLDGTLTDSAPGIVRCIQHAMRGLNREPWPACTSSAYAVPSATRSR